MLLLLLLLPRIGLGKRRHPSTPRQLARCDLSVCHLASLVSCVSHRRETTTFAYGSQRLSRVQVQPPGCLPSHAGHCPPTSASIGPFAQQEAFPTDTALSEVLGGIELGWSAVSSGGAMLRPKCPPIVVCLPRAGMGILIPSARIPSPKNCIIGLCTLT